MEVPITEDEDPNISSMVNRFRSNFMKLNGDKCHLLIFSTQDSTLSMKTLNIIITESQEEKLLGVTLDRTLSFQLHLENLCIKSAKEFTLYHEY